MEFQLKRADKQGKVQVHGPHYYSVPPEYASSEAVVALRYLTVSLQDRLGNEVAKYERAYTARRTDRKNAWFSLQRLVIKPVNDTLRMYKSDDIRMYNFDCITDTIVEVITTCNTYTLLTVHLL